PQAAAPPPAAPAPAMAPEPKPQAQAVAQLKKKMQPVQQDSALVAEGDRLAANGQCQESLTAYNRAGVNGAKKLPYVRCLVANHDLSQAQSVIDQLGDDPRVVAERQAIHNAQKTGAKGKAASKRAVPAKAAPASPADLPPGL